MVSTTRESRIFTAPEVLDDGYLPTSLTGGDAGLAEVQDCLAPVLRKQKPLHVWLYGAPGTGKTATARSVLEEMQRKWGAQGAYVNCWQHDSLYSILDCLTAELRILRAEEQRTARKLEKFEQRIKDAPFVLILDEIDKPLPKERSDILYSLCGLPKVGLISISNSIDPLFDLDARVRSRLNPALVAFQPHTQKELRAILVERAREALADRSWDSKTLRKIAELAKGDARVALQTLKKAAWTADGQGAGKITDQHVRKAWTATQELRRQYVLGKLTPDHRVLYRIVAYQRQILSSDLRQLYLVECSRTKRKPVAERTFSDYVNDLKRAGLADVERARVKGKVRLVRILE